VLRVDSVSVADHRRVYVSQVGDENNVLDNKIICFIRDGQGILSITFLCMHKYQLVDRQQAVASISMHTSICVLRTTGRFPMNPLLGRERCIVSRVC